MLVPAVLAGARYGSSDAFPFSKAVLRCLRFNVVTQRKGRVSSRLSSQGLE